MTLDRGPTSKYVGMEVPAWSLNELRAVFHMPSCLLHLFVDVGIQFQPGSKCAPKYFNCLEGGEPLSRTSEPIFNLGLWSQKFLTSVPGVVPGAVNFFAG